MTLGPDARDLLAAAEGGDDPSEADAARVRAKLAARLAITAAGTGIAASTAAKSASAGAGSVAAASTGAVASTGSKLLIAAALVGSTVVTTVAVKSMPSAPSTPAFAITSAARKGPPVSSSPVPVPVPVPVPDPAPADPDLVPIPVSALPSAKAPSEPPRARVATQSAAPSSPPSERSSAAPTAPTPSSTPVDTIAEEAAILRHAQSALARGDGAGALAQTGEHEQRFPRGALAEERNALRVLALCAAGNAEAARAAASAFVAASPRSPLAAQVRASCADRSAAPR